MKDKSDEILQRLDRIEIILKRKESSLSKFFYIIEKLLIPLALVALTLIANQASIRISEAQKNLAERQEARQAQDAKENMDLKYVELFYKDITSQNAETQSIALSLLNLMQPNLGKSLAIWVEQNTKLPNPIREQAKVIRNEIDKLGELSNYTIAIYFLKNIEGISDIAQDIKNKLIKYGFQSGRLQVRAASESFFKYVVPPDGYEIRYQPNYEDDAAEKLRGILTEIYPIKPFRIQPAEGKRTPNFISIFLGS